MRYCKSGTICHRTIKSDDVIAIATFFEKLAQQDNGENYFSISFRDNLSVTDKCKDIFSADVFRRKDIQSITLEYEDKRAGKTLRVNFQEEILFSDITNTYDIISSDENWYTSIQTQLGDLLGTISKHHWIRKMFDFPFILISYLIHWLALTGLMRWPLGFEYGVKTEDAAVFIPFPVFFVFGTFIFMAVTAVTYLLFPDMEFDFETPRSVKRKKIRKALVWIAGTIVLPLIFAFLMR